MSHLPAAYVVPVETFGQHPAEDPEQFHPLNRQEVVPEGCQRDGTGWVQARGGATADGCRGMVQILRGKRAEPGTSGPGPTKPRGRWSLCLLYPPRLRVCKVRVLVGSVFTPQENRSGYTLQLNGGGPLAFWPVFRTSHSDLSFGPLRHCGKRLE